MKRLISKIQSEIYMSLIILGLVVVLLLTEDVAMADSVIMMMAAGILVAFSAYALFIWKQSPQDEREELHMMESAKVAYLTGAATLTGVIIYQLIDHSLDMAFPIILGVMVLSKSLSQYVQSKK